MCHEAHLNNHEASVKSILCPKVSCFVSVICTSYVPLRPKFRKIQTLSPTTREIVKVSSRNHDFKCPIATSDILSQKLSLRCVRDVSEPKFLMPICLNLQQPRKSRSFKPSKPMQKVEFWCVFLQQRHNPCFVTDINGAKCYNPTSVLFKTPSKSRNLNAINLPRHTMPLSVNSEQSCR